MIDINSEVIPRAPLHATRRRIEVDVNHDGEGDNDRHTKAEKVRSS